jgi:hypothetical protein
MFELGWLVANFTGSGLSAANKNPFVLRPYPRLSVANVIVFKQADKIFRHGAFARAANIQVAHYI